MTGDIKLKDSPIQTAFRTREADKYELGMAKNNATVIIAAILQADMTSDNILRPDYKKISSQVNELARQLYKDGQLLRKNILKY